MARLTIGPGAFSSGDWFAFTDLSYGPVCGYQHVVDQSGDGHLRERALDLASRLGARRITS